MASRTFGQVGQLASSRSASQTFAPELSALMAIFAGVAGPVISTRRSCSAGGAGATVHSPVRISAVSARKSSVRACATRSRRALRADSNSVAAAPEAAVQRLDESQRIGGEDLLRSIHRAASRSVPGPCGPAFLGVDRRRAE